MSTSRFEQLIGACFDDTITDAEAGELADLLAADASYREAFAQQAMMADRISAAVRADRSTEAFTESLKVRIAAAADVGFPEKVMTALRNQSATSMSAAVESPRRRLPIGWLALAAMLALAIGAGLWIEAMRRPATHPAAAAQGVALLTNMDKAVFAAEQGPMNLGDDLRPGRIDLASGSAQLMFKSGAVVELAGPCEFEMTGPNQAYLHRGILHAVVPQRARGFVVQTSEGVQAVDLGTEFTMQYDPPKPQVTVRVLRGSVSVSASSSAGKPTVQTIRAGYAAIANAGRLQVTPMWPNTQPWVLAYWRFEQGLPGQLASMRSLRAGVTAAVIDSSTHGADLSVFGEPTAPRFSSRVPQSIVPAYGVDNQVSLDTTQPTAPNVPTRDLYCAASGRLMQPLTTWSIEASIMIADHPQPDENQTFVSCDADHVVTDDPKLSSLYMQVLGDGYPAIAFADVRGQFHILTPKTMRIDPQRWYHLAAVCDGHQLSLYADALDGAGYRLLGSLALPDADVALASAGKTWAVGRGWFDGHPADRFVGWIDEVRLSDRALSPSDFLFASSPGDVSSPAAK